MNVGVSSLDSQIASVVEIVEKRTIAFLDSELGLAAKKIERRMHNEELVQLRDMTAIVGVSSKAGLYIAFSYDDALIRAMTKRYTAGLSIAADQEHLYASETASDIVNVIVGNSTADLAKRDEIVTLSPPVLLVGGRTIRGHRDTTIAVLTLRFAEGALDVAFVGPSIQFDNQLNYRGAVS